MSARKARLTVTIDRELIAAGSAAVARGRAESVSGWVNQALAERVARDRRLAALAEAVAAYEADHGSISDQELVAQARADRRGAVVVRGGVRAKPRRRARTA
jgi:hypothetical protein